MRAWVAVFVGGLVGAGLRLGADLALPHADDAFPWSTLLVNLAGAFALGCLAGGLWRRPATPDWLKAGIGAGVIGTFTTLSALMASLVLLGHAGEWWLGALYLAVSVVGGLALAGLGLALGARLARQPVPREVTDRGVDL